MAELTAAPAPVPAAGSPKALNGAKPNVPQVPSPAVPTTPVVDPLAEAKSLREAAAAERQAAALERRQSLAREKRWRDEQKSTKTELDELRKIQAAAKANPEAHLKSLYGDGWYDTVVNTKINGTPPAQLIQDEMTRMREEVREEMRKEFTTRDEEAKRQKSEASQQSLVAARRKVQGDAHEFLKTSGAEYPALEDMFSTPQQIAQQIASYVEAEYMRTVQYDSETKELLREGRVLSPQQAAEELENKAIALAEKLYSRQKYADKLRAKLAPAADTTNPVPRNGVSSQRTEPRKTLSNDLTGSTPSNKPAALTDRERRERAIAAFQAARKKQG